MTAADALAEHPLEFRLLLIEAFADAERRGLGTVQPGFTAHRGLADQAADLIAHRVEHLLAARGFLDANEGR